MQTLRVVIHRHIFSHIGNRRQPCSIQTITGVLVQQKLNICGPQLSFAPCASVRPMATGGLCLMDCSTQSNFPFNNIAFINLTMPSRVKCITDRVHGELFLKLHVVAKIHASFATTTRDSQHEPKYHERFDLSVLRIFGTHSVRWCRWII